MAKTVLTDTCFWLGLVDPEDQYHDVSNTIADLLNEGEYQLLFPWPCLYETLSTRLIRRRDQLLILEDVLKKSEVVIVEDGEYKFLAMNEVFENNRIRNLNFSLVDNVMRGILKDENVKINYLLTYNERDFLDVCALRQIEILNG